MKPSIKKNLNFEGWNLKKKKFKPIFAWGIKSEKKFNLKKIKENSTKNDK